MNAGLVSRQQLVPLDAKGTHIGLEFYGVC